MCARALAIAWTVVLLVLLWLPGGEIEPTSGWLAVAVQHGLDKALHVVFFALHGGLTARALAGPSNRLSRPRVVGLTLGLGGALGAVSELGQRWVPGRAAGWDDTLADLVGVAVGALLVTVWAPRRLPNPMAR